MSDGESGIWVCDGQATSAERAIAAAKSIEKPRFIIGKSIIMPLDKQLTLINPKTGKSCEKKWFMVGFSLYAKLAVFFHPVLVFIRPFRRFMVRQSISRTPVPFSSRLISPFVPLFA